MGEAQILWVGCRSRNPKTGAIPQGFIGASREESLSTCDLAECPMRPKSRGGEPGRRCYSQCGRPGMAHSSVVRGYERDPGRYDLRRVLADLHPDAKAVRIGAVGDPVGCPRRVKAAADRIRQAGLAVLCYTHGWRKRPSLRRYSMASCDSLAEADEAAAKGWRVAVVLPGDHEERRFTTPNGRRGIVCPAMASGGKVQCNDCRLCDASKAGPVIGFPDHGPGSRRKG